MTAAHTERARPRILAVDDEATIRDFLTVVLEREGFTVRTVADASAALDAVREFEPECVLLDVMMPKIDGVTLLPMLRRLTEAPIILLTARADVRDRVEGLAAGADDYVPKPFDVDELVARVRTALRRPTLRHVDTLRYDDLTIDLETRTVQRGARDIALTTREFDLLATLARRPKRVFTRMELLDLVWGDESEVVPSTVETYISYVRAKLDWPGEPPLLKTVRGVGYTLRRS
ncbi:MAG TPA: response regulator transcription factor [Candidatus Baltobacteraceae bacterium]|nr:response regulator transcription factor [Candidatus Baltobacteraceae bacterium]